jgi:DNA-binding MarR family transcriptional regulator
MTTDDRPAARRRHRDLSSDEYQALGAFRQALRRFLAFSEAGAQALGLTPQQHQALLAVRAHSGPEPMSVGELARALLVRNHSALGLVDRLVERGLLERSYSQTDGRRVLLALSELGRAKLETISRNNLGELKSDLPVFTDLLQALEQLEPPAASPRQPSDKPKSPRRARRT